MTSPPRDQQEIKYVNSSTRKQGSDLEIPREKKRGLKVKPLMWPGN